jgi:CHASE3 domain sensor protein
MTISKKLYLGFGAILAIMLFLFIINIFTVAREYNARSASAATLADVQTIESVRYQMMENRLFLGNYLLSGDLRDEDKTNKGVADLLTLAKDGANKANDPYLRNALAQVEENERNW